MNQTLNIPQMRLTNTLITFTEALKFASIKHKNQRRKNGDIPYINHPIEVASILANAGVTDYNVLSAAILHDTIQDTQTTAQQLQNLFGKQITKLVLQCSDDKSINKVERKRIQIDKAHKSSKQAILIKIADKISNCWDVKRNGAPPSWNQQRIFGYYLWAFTVCKTLRGFNQVLDKQMDQLFQVCGVSKIAQEQSSCKLTKYYEILGKCKGEK